MRVIEVKYRRFTPQEIADGKRKGKAYTFDNVMDVYDIDKSHTSYSFLKGYYGKGSSFFSRLKDRSNDSEAIHLLVYNYIKGSPEYNSNVWDDTVRFLREKRLNKLLDEDNESN